MAAPEHAAGPEGLALPCVQIGMERSRVAELEERSAALREQVAGQRKAMGGVNAAQESTIAVSRSRCLCGVALGKSWHGCTQTCGCTGMEPCGQLSLMAVPGCSLATSAGQGV